MSQYLLRVEATNLGEVIADTDDLSTRRGGGLLVLNAVRQLVGDPTANPPVAGTLTPKELRDRLYRVATGASVGLFTFDAADDADAERVRDAVASHFRTDRLEYVDPEEPGKIKHVPLAYGTFVVRTQVLDTDAQQSVEQAIADIRWQQMRHPSLSLAGAWDRAGEDCNYNCVRPAEPGLLLPKDRSRERPRGRSLDVCRTVHDRHRYGRAARQDFYRDELGHRPAYEFTDAFDKLSKPHPAITARVPANAADKLAVLYLDGNQFGEYGRAALANGMHEYGMWSDKLRDHHRELLGQLTAKAETDDTWRTDDDDIRLETLLWGGDEIVWVVPAWKGWELVEWFFRQPHDVMGRSLTYGAGLVFCHVTAPIKDILALAQNRLAELAKDAGRKENRSLVAYEVLESFDDVYGDLADHRNRWLPEDLRARVGDGKSDPLFLDPAKLSLVWRDLKAIAAARDFPMRQLYRLCRLWRAAEPADAKEKEKAETRLRGCEVGTPFAAVEAALGETAWLHLLNILPYLPEAAA